MKVSFRFILATLAATAVLAGCVQEITPPSFENDKVAPASEGSRVIAVSFGNRTKTYLADDGLQPKFNDGDSILISNGVALDTCEVSVNGDKATISTDLTGPLTAVYPYKAAMMNGSNANQVDSVLVSTEQDGTFANANICMAKMTSENDESLSFENKTAVFCIYLPAGKDAQHVKVSAEGFVIANNIPTGLAIMDSSTIHVNTTTADSVYVSILVPDGLTAGALSFSDGVREKYVPNDKASTAIAVNTIYTVTEDGWKTPAPAEPEYIVMKMGGDQSKSLRWATMNLGATTVAGSGETCFGNYYAWGETEPYYATRVWNSSEKKWEVDTWKADKDNGYAWPSYCNGSSSFVEWSILPYDNDTKILKAGYDAATAELGIGWRMPTSDDFKALYRACGGTGTSCTSTSDGSKSTTAKGIYWCASYDGVAGLLFIAEDNGPHLFFPAAGDGYSTRFVDVGYLGLYWSSTHNYSIADHAYYLRCANGFVSPQYNGSSRYSGFSIRPVADMPDDPSEPSDPEEEAPATEMTEKVLF